MPLGQLLINGRFRISRSERMLSISMVSLSKAVCPRNTASRFGLKFRYVVSQYTTNPPATCAVFSHCCWFQTGTANVRADQPTITKSKYCLSASVNKKSASSVIFGDKRRLRRCSWPVLLCRMSVSHCSVSPTDFDQSTSQPKATIRVPVMRSFA